MDGVYRWLGLIAILPVGATVAYRQWEHASRSAFASSRRGYDRLNEYERTKKRATLELAIDDLRRGLDSKPASARQRAANLSNLGRALLLRSVSTGSLDDLAEAVSLGRRALLEIGEAHPERVKHVNNLAEFIRRQGFVTRRPELADEAVALAQAAVEATPENDDRRASRLENLDQARRLQKHLRP